MAALSKGGTWAAVKDIMVSYIKGNPTTYSIRISKQTRCKYTHIYVYI